MEKLASLPFRAPKRAPLRQIRRGKARFLRHLCIGIKNDSSDIYCANVSVLLRAVAEEQRQNTGSGQLRFVWSVYVYYVRVLEAALNRLNHVEVPPPFSPLTSCALPLLPRSG